MTIAHAKGRCDVIGGVWVIWTARKSRGLRGGVVGNETKAES